MAANLTPEQLAYLRKYFAENGATRQTQFGNGDSGPTYNTETNFATPPGGGKYEASGNGEFAQDLGNNQYAFYDSNGNYTTTKTISPDWLTQMMPYIVGAGLGGIALFGGAAGAAGAAEGAGLTELGIPGSAVGSGEVAATGLLEPGAAEAAAGAAAGGGAAGGGAAGAAGAAAKGLLNSDIVKAGVAAAGGLLGSQPTTSSTSSQSKIDPRLDKYIYGDGNTQGLLNQAYQWQQANKSGLNDDMRSGLAAINRVASDPSGYQAIAKQGLSLMNQPIAGNPFSNGQAFLQVGTPQALKNLGLK